MYIGIDLGTSNSVIAGFVKDDVKVFRPADGGEALPSMIFFDKRGHRLYGRRAHDQALLNPDNVATGFKRLMGSATPIEIKGLNLKLSPEECSAEIIRQLLGQMATETGGAAIEGAVITIPAAFNQMQAEATMQAAKSAGLEKVDLLQEPIAAAMAAMANMKKRSGQFLIYDLGGGTFDLALASAVNGEVKIIAHRGINMLGGRDFDRMIVNEIVRPWLNEHFDLPDNFQRDGDWRRLIRVAQLAAEKAKIDLSSANEATIFASADEIRLTDMSDSEIFLETPITRQQLEALIRDPIMQTIDLIREVLSENNYKNEDIDRIVFIGGPSRIPLIRDMVSRELGIAADLSCDPMTAVAVGAAYYAEGRLWKENNTSTAKPVAEVKATPQEPNILFKFPARTADDKALVEVRLSGALPAERKIEISSKDWKSGALVLKDGITISLPLAEKGEHNFQTIISDKNGKALPQHNQTLTITRLAAQSSSIPAAQTIAVKVLEKSGAQENIFLPLVTKGDKLPAKGEAKFRTARMLKSGDAGAISFELFQVEYPERIDLNLCVGVFRISGQDLPPNYVIKTTDTITFDWMMNEGGILTATVRLSDDKDSQTVQLSAPRFYAPQAGQISFDPEQGAMFARSVMKQSEEEWGDLVAATGPEAGPEITLIKTRLDDQREILTESGLEAENIRLVTEEVRFIRQDTARIATKYRGAMMQRRLGKINAVFNRVARAKANPKEISRFDGNAAKIQTLIDKQDFQEFSVADGLLADMRDLFFVVSWRDQDYVATWFKRLMGEPFLFADRAEFDAMVREGEKYRDNKDLEAFRNLTKKLLQARIALSVNEMAGDLASIVKAS